MSKINLSLQSSDELNGFLKKFSAISNSLLIEMNNGYLSAKSHTPERSVVKSSKIELNRIFSSDESEDVIFGVYSLDRLTKAFSHFGQSPINFILETESTSDGVIGTALTLKNDQLDINYQCASLKLFTHITDEMMDRIANHENAKVSFVLSKELQARINSLTSLDPDQKILNLEVKGGVVKASGKTFNLNLLNIDDKSADISIAIYKSQFAYLDKEDHMVYMNEDRLIFHSIETDTKMIIGKVE
jgi:hypothetical protein